MNNKEIVMLGAIGVLGVFAYKSLKANAAAYSVLTNNGTQSIYTGAALATGNQTGYSGYSPYAAGY